MNSKCIKLVTLLILSFISYQLIIPKNSGNLVVKGGLNKFSFSVTSPEFKSYLQSAGLPVVIEPNSYNLKIANLNKEYDIDYSLTFSENDRILKYLEQNIGSSTPSIDGHPGFDIKTNKNYLIKNIPVEIPILSEYGSFSSCGFFGSLEEQNTAHCPDDPKKMSELSIKNISIVAIPNTKPMAHIIQIIIIIIFWMITINAFTDFFQINRISARDPSK